MQVSTETERTQHLAIPLAGSNGQSICGNCLCFSQLTDDSNESPGFIEIGGAERIRPS
jgi:hypothetical protein